LHDEFFGERPSRALPQRRNDFCGRREKGAGSCKSIFRPTVFLEKIANRRRKFRSAFSPGMEGGRTMVATGFRQEHIVKDLA
jgi:hypothetical protein